MLTRKKRMALGALAGIGAALFALPYVLPWSALIPRLEAELGRQLHQPVKVRQLRVALLPVPKLSVHDVSVGQAPLLHIDRVTVRPRLLSLFSRTRVLNTLRLEGVRVNPGFFKQARFWIQEHQAATGGGADPPPSVQVERVVLSNVEIAFDRFTLKSLSGEILFASGRPVEVRGAQDTDRLQVIARPQAGQRWSLDVRGQNWTVPAGLPVVFDRLQGAAIVTTTAISAEHFRGNLYNGAVSGSLAMSWNRGWLVQGEWDVQQVDMRPLAALLKRDVAIDGTLTAHPLFTLRAQDPAALLDGMTLESDFSLRSGAIQKVDLVAAAKNPLSANATKGGKTEFEQLSGHVLADADGYEFTGLQVTSGALAATGDVTVARDQKLEGRIDAELKGTASLASIPLELAGTVQNPALFPSRAAVVGAVAGSLFLPGIGTAVGIKVSRFAEKIFTRRKPTRKNQGAPAR